MKFSRDWLCFSLQLDRVPSTPGGIDERRRLSVANDDVCAPSWWSDPPLHANRRRKARVAREIHICWRSCRLRRRRGHSATTISDGGGHRQSRATLNETTNYARATRMTVTPNKKWCWFLGQYRRRLSWAADRRHDQNQASPIGG